MFSNIICMIMMAVGILGKVWPGENLSWSLEDDVSTGNTSTYLPMIFLKHLHKFNFFDTPDRITGAITTRSKNILPDRASLEYYVYYAAAAYDTYYLQDMTCLYCDKFRHHIDEITTQGDLGMVTSSFVTRSDARKEVVITFRGTTSGFNWFEDFNVEQQDVYGYKVHAGFNACVLSLYDEVVKVVIQYRIKYPDYSITLTGHSLGAAMARICLFYFLYLKQFPGATYKIITYGEPRTGNVKWADYFNNQRITAARCVARGDMIPHCPMTNLGQLPLTLNAYVHVQTEYWINGDESRFCDQSVYEDPTCSNSLGPLYVVMDHLTYFNCHLALCFGENPSYNHQHPFQNLTRTHRPLPKRIAYDLGRRYTDESEVEVPFWR